MLWFEQNGIADHEDDTVGYWCFFGWQPKWVVRIEGQVKKCEHASKHEDSEE